MCDKPSLRKYYASARAAARSAEADRRIFERFRRSPFWEAESFFVYCSVGTEADTRALIAALLAAKKRVCLPRISGGEMLSSPYFGGELSRGAYGIPAPAAGQDCLCEVTVTPLLAADGEGYRLGYGGGYYDRYFASHPPSLRVGLGYSVQFADRLPRGEHDIPLHALVTENALLRFNA